MLFKYINKLKKIIEFHLEFTDVNNLSRTNKHEISINRDYYRRYNILKTFTNIFCF